MRIGIPGGLLYYSYQPFISAFFGELGVATKYSTQANRGILNLGAKNCVDEACLPIKIFHGHVMELQKDCDYVAIPRIMNCEFGQSICPKFDGLPELVASGTKRDNYVFTQPIHMNDSRGFMKGLCGEGKKLGVSRRRVQSAFDTGVENQRNSSHGINDDGYKHKVFLGGHPYNLYDSFANMNLVSKLHKLGIGVITEEWVSNVRKREQLSKLIKKPYWLFFENNFGAVKALEESGEAEGIIYVSSFCCGTDSFTIEMIKNNTSLPNLILKLDEQTGEAGFDTRLEAFSEMLDMRAAKRERRMPVKIKCGGEAIENDISSLGRCAYCRQDFL